MGRPRYSIRPHRGTRVLDAFAAATGKPPASYPGELVQPGLTRRADLGGLDLARVLAVFIECAAMRNPADAGRVRHPAWRQLAAEGIHGIAASVEQS